MDEKNAGRGVFSCFSGGSEGEQHKVAASSFWQDGRAAVSAFVAFFACPTAFSEGGTGGFRQIVSAYLFTFTPLCISYSVYMRPFVRKEWSGSAQ